MFGNTLIGFAAPHSSALLHALLITWLLGAGAPAGATTQNSEGSSGGEGSGQFTGLLQSASANLFNGSMATSVPILLPPGRGGATPDLALRYVSSGGDGAFGRGWSIPGGSIERSTKRGVPRCEGDLSSNEFVLNLPGSSVDLVWVAGANVFRAATDEGFLEVVADTTNNEWTLNDRSGTQYTFGSVSTSRVFNASDVFMDTSACAFTTYWALTRIENANGDAIDYAYTKDGNTLYPFEIVYGGNVDDTGSFVMEHAFRVGFSTGPRALVGRSYRRGADQARSLRVESIEVEYRPDASSGFALIRSYALGYVESETGRHLLLDSVATAGLPAQTFDYATDDIGFSSTLNYTPPDVPGEGEFYFREWADARKVTRSVMDINGDGRMDLVDTNTSSAWNVYPGLPGGGFAMAPIGWDVSATDPAWVNSMQRTTNGDISRFQQDTFDINGDGVPDWVDARSTPWLVYPGGCTSATACGFGSAVAWPAPEAELRRATGTWTSKETLDLNGDGLADLVIADGGGAWEVYWNEGDGFASTPDPNFVESGFLGRVFHQTGGGDVTERTLFDMNGDGLADLVESPHNELAALDANGAILGILPETASCDLSHNSGWNTFSGCNGPLGTVTYAGFLSVRFGTGTGFDAQPVYSVLQLQGVRFQFVNRTRTDFADLNGDGFPDYIIAGPFGSIAGNEEWRVALNRGDGTLEPPVVVAANASPNQVVFTRPWFEGGSVPVTGHVRRTPQSGSNTRTDLDLLDWNADGLLDRVDASDANAWKIDIAEAQSGELTVRPLSLVHMDDGARGETFVRYAPSSLGDHAGADGAGDLPYSTWVVTGIRRTSGLCAATPGVTDPDFFDPAENPCIDLGHEWVSTFEYKGGLFDAASREFRGFKNVTEFAPDGSRVETTFLQDDDFRGKVGLAETFARGSSEALRRTTNLWQARVSSLDAQRRQVYLAETREENFAIPHAAGPVKCQLSRNEPPDDYGRIAHTCSLACSAAPPTPGSCANPPAGQVETLMTWAMPSSSSSRAVYARPSLVETRWVAQPGGVPLRLSREQFEYDGLPPGLVDRGRVTQVRESRDQSHAGAVVDPVTTTSYDSVGNVISRSVGDANFAPGAEATTTWVYDDNLFRLYPTQVQYPDPGTGALHQSIALTDLRFGSPTVTTDANGQTTDRVYDTFGRLLCEAGPLHDIAGCGTGNFTHSLEYQYVLADPAGTSFSASHSRVISRTHNAAGSPIEATVYSDALGRERYREVDQVIGGATAAVQTVVRGQVVYDAAGRIVESFGPYVGPAVDPDVQQPVGALTALDYTLNGLSAGGSAVLDPLGRPHRVIPPDGHATTTFYEGARTRSIDALGNEQLTLADAFGNEVRRELYDQGALTVETDSVYDGAGRLIAQTSANDPATTVFRSYDSLGNLVSLDDPDSGLWRYAYDARGNVIYEDSPRAGMHVQVTYDALSRRRLRCIYGVDAYVATLESSCGAGGTQESAYSWDSGAFSVGRRSGVADLSGSEGTTYDERGRVVEVTKTIHSVPATVNYVYDLSDRIASIEYPDGEVVSHGYNAVGAPVSLTSDDGTVYLADAVFDIMGRTTRLLRGNGVNDDLSFYGASEGHRLQRIEVSNASAASLLDLEYDYNTLGKVSDITDHRDAGTHLSQASSMTYDGLGRLVDYDWDDSAPGENYDAAYVYSPQGNLVQRGGDAIGYGANGAGPHQATSHEASEIGYFADGSRWLKIDWAGFPFAPLGKWQLYGYDALGRLTGINMGEGTGAPALRVKYVYDHAGKRVVKTQNGKGKYRYFGQLAESAGGRLTKYYYAGEMRIASREVGGIAFSETPLGTLQRDTWRIPPEAAGAALVLTAGLLAFGTSRRRRGALGRGAPGIGRVAATCGLAVVASTPVGILLPSAAQAATIDVVRHFHVDHLGSTQAVTNGSGTLVHQVRYQPYGEVRGRYDAAGVSRWQPASIQNEFTGHQADFWTGIVYAGLRHYDPLTGQFLSQDPVRQFASPYAYGPGDPMNGTDPSGGCFFGIDCAVIATIAQALVAVSVGLVVARAIQVGIQTGSVGAAFESLAADGASLIAAANVVTGFIALLPEITQVIAQIGAAGYAGYQTADEVRSGDVIGALSAGVGALASVTGATLAGGRGARVGAGEVAPPQVASAGGASLGEAPVGVASNVSPVTYPSGGQESGTAKAEGLARVLELAARYADQAARAHLTAKMRGEQQARWLEVRATGANRELWVFEVFRVRTFPATGQSAAVDGFNVFVPTAAGSGASDVNFPGLMVNATSRFDHFDVSGPFRLGQRSGGRP